MFVRNGIAAAADRDPLVTVWFMLYGAVTVASEALHMDLSHLPAPARVLVNLAYLVGCYALVSPLLPQSHR